MPTGAPADVAELEFLSALLQTSPELKTYITGKDIHCYLISRHGLKREIREIEDCILKELAGCIVQEDIVKAEAEQPLGLKEGGESENAKESSANATAQDTETAENENPAVEKQGKSKISQHQAVENKLEWEEAVDVEPRNESMEEPREEPNMDLVQLLALLMIPELVREIDAEQQVLFRVFFQILADGSGIAPETLLTKEVLETILTTYGECWPDFVLEEMLSACRPHGSSELPIFDKETMARALTVDIIEYPLNQETMTTTHQQDAATPKGVSLSRMFTAPNIDYTADSFRSYLWAGLTWMTLVVTFIAYLFKGISGVDIKMKTLECDPGNVTLSDDNSTYTGNPDVGCTVANGIVVWIQIFLVLVVVRKPLFQL